ncbi:MAG TPA: hypothetical protein VN783_16795 [Thermoanaerobaculia bacterium]|nr:hypothetical protein [Thermoanaerobaculia bacterium]
MTIPWKTVGAVPSSELWDARRALHWAVQAAASIGKQLVAPRLDGGEQSLVWDGNLGLLIQDPVSGAAPSFRSALRLEPPALVLTDEAGESAAEFSLAGRTLAEAYAWLAREAEARLGRPLEKPLERPAADKPEETEMPDHPVAHGAPFEVSRQAAAELARWFDDGEIAIAAVAESAGNASPLRVWPHHFDLAIVLTLEGEGEDARALYVGMTPGDVARPAPYFYVTPWPPPENPEPQPLPAGGVWNRDPWFGAVLEGARLIEAGDGAAQAARTEEFFRAAIPAARRFALGGKA